MTVEPPHITEMWRVCPANGKEAEMTDTIDQPATPIRRKRRRVSKPRLSAVEKLTSEALQTLRLDESARAEFDACVKRFGSSIAALRAFDNEDVASMDDARDEQRSTAEAEVRRHGMALVHFMAPRILKLRDGTAKRKWRSFLTKFRREEKLL